MSAHESHATEHAHDAHEAVECEVDRPKNAVILAAVVAIVATVFLVVVGVYQYFGFVIRDEQDRKADANPNAELRDLRAREHARLSTYQWVSQKDGVVRIPVSEARDIVLREWATRNPPNVPVAGGAGSAAAVASATPAASGSAAPATSAAPAAPEGKPAH